MTDSDERQAQMGGRLKWEGQMIGLDGSVRWETGSNGRQAEMGDTLRLRWETGSDGKHNQMGGTLRGTLRY